jgi:hypothetical protein
MAVVEKVKIVHLARGSFRHSIFIMVFGYFRQMLYISLLFTNAVAILSEDRFLAKSEHPGNTSDHKDGPGAKLAALNMPINVAHSTSP